LISSYPTISSNSTSLWNKCKCKNFNKDFTGRPLDELKFVVSANLTRRHLDEFQKAEIAIKFDKLFRKIARDKWLGTKFTSETAKEAGVKSGISRQPTQQQQQQQMEQQEELEEPDERVVFTFV
jgi:hypothetical protein